MNNDASKRLTWARVGSELALWLRTLASAAVYAVLILTFGFQVARVEGHSMLAYQMHDPRNNSSDSRLFGPVPKKYILGRVQIRWWPFATARPFEP